MKIITLLSLCYILTNAKVVATASHVININLLQSLSKVLNPYQKKFYAFLCLNEEDDSAYRQTLLKKMNFLTFGIADISKTNLPYGPEFNMATLLLDMDCDGARRFWEMLDLEMMVTNKILLWNVVGEDLKVIKGKEGLEGIIEVYLVERELHEVVLVKKVTKKEFHHTANFLPFAAWSNETLQILQQKSSFISRDRYDLQGASIRVCIVIPTPDTRHHLTDGVDRHIDTNTKHSYIVTLELLDFLNATPVYSYETIWGYYNKSSSSWNGMIQRMIDRQTDISGTAIWVTANRVSIIQYVYRTSAADVWFLFQNPRLSFTDNLYLLPFSQVTWICAFSLVPLLALSIAFIRYYSEVKIDERQSDDQQPDLGESFYMILTIVCQQGFNNTIHSISARLLMFFSFFTLMLLYVSYAATLVALLQSSSKRINSLHDLLESKMKLGVEDAIYNRIYFAMQRDPIKKAIYERKIINRDGSKNFIPVELGIEKVRNELYAFHTEVGNAYRFIAETYNQNEICRLNRLKYLVVDSPYHLIRKNATFKEIMTVALSRINEHGILKKVTEPFYAQKPGCTGSSVKFFAINLHDVRPAFIFLGSGYAISLLIFVAEISIANHRKRKQLKRVDAIRLSEDSEEIE